ncbi:hypothetical protein GDO81_022309, partial [Engystomops pustulosus]
MTSSYSAISLVFVTCFAIALAQPNTCSQCWNIGSTECCNAKVVPCPTDKCLAIYEYCVVDGVIYQTISKRCGDEASCGICFSVTTERGITARAATECGTGANSNADLTYK